VIEFKLSHWQKKMNLTNPTELKFTKTDFIYIFHSAVSRDEAPVSNTANPKILANACYQSSGSSSPVRQSLDKSDFSAVLERVLKKLKTAFVFLVACPSQTSKLAAFVYIWRIRTTCSSRS
jgi:hypothetical protein